MMRTRPRRYNLLSFLMLSANAHPAERHISCLHVLVVSSRCTGSYHGPGLTPSISPWDISTLIRRDLVPETTSIPLAWSFHLSDFFLGPLFPGICNNLFHTPIPGRIYARCPHRDYCLSLLVDIHKPASEQVSHRRHRRYYLVPFLV